jgi:7,8-dihydropterin-6-yl-methyl-4-(beta-D-ribofuranosyl)aminobenzene 5'-phosphate synthase
MSQKISITVLVENSVHERGLKAEHGLAWHIQFESHQVLFDTGQTDLLVENARQLGISLERLNAIVLSHGHYDHTGGLVAVVASSPCPPIFLHPAAREPKFSLQPDGTPRFIGLPEASRAVLAHHQARIIETRTCTEVVKGLFVTGELPRRTPYEDTGGRLFLDERATQPDTMRDDQAVFFDTSAGVVVMLGCAHAGVINTLDYIQGLNPGRPFRAVLGGLHLLNASPERLAATVEALRQREIPLLVPAHCTGAAAVARLWESFPGRCAAPGVGRRFAFER